MVVEYFLSGISEPKPAETDKREIQPLNKVSVIEAEDFCVLTKGFSRLSRLTEALWFLPEET